VHLYASVLVANIERGLVSVTVISPRSGDVITGASVVQRFLMDGFRTALDPSSAPVTTSDPPTDAV
jgi:hypothetical protein